MLATLLLALTSNAQALPQARLALPSAGHTNRITAIALSPDAAWVASADRLGFVQIRAAQGGREHFHADLVRQPERGVEALAWSGDANFVAAAASEAVTVVELRTMEVFARLPLEGASDVSDDLEGDTLLAAGVAKSRWWLARVRPQEIEADELIGGPYSGDPAGLAKLTRHGTRACVALPDGSAKLVDLALGELTLEFPAADAVRGFLPDGRLLSLATDPQDKKVQHLTWRDGASGVVLGTRDFLASSEFYSQRVWWHGASGFSLPIVDSHLRRFHGEELSAPAPLPRDVDPLVGAPGRQSGEWIVSLATPVGVNRYELGFYDERKQAIVERWEGRTDAVRSMRAEPGANEMWIGGAHPARVSWGDAGMSVVPLPAQPQLVARRPGGGLLVARAEPFEVQFLAAKGAVEARLSLGEGQYPQEILLDPSGRHAAVRTWNRLHLVAVTARTLEWSKDVGASSVTFSALGALAFSPDGERVAVSGYRTHTNADNSLRVDGELALFEVADGRVAWTAPVAIAQMRFVLDGTQIGGIHGDHNQYVAVSATTGELERSPYWENRLGGHRGTWLQSGKLAAVGSGTTVYLTRPNDGYCERQIQVPDWTYSALAFGPEDRHVWLGCDDGRVQVLDGVSGAHVATLATLEGGEWVVATPDGRFDASPKALEELFYVRGREALPLAAFSEAFYTPRLLHRALSGEVLPPPKVELAKLEAPPRVELLASGPVSATGTVELVLRAHGSRAPGELRLFHNGKRVPLSGKPEKDGDSSAKATASFSLEHSLELVPGPNLLRLVALTSQRTESAPAELALERGGAVAAHPRLFLLACGVNEYANPKYNLNYARADAQAFSAAWRERAGGLFEQADITLALDAEVTRAGLAQHFERIAASASPTDVFVFYYAGHGVIDGRGAFHLAPHDITQLYGDDTGLAQRGVPTKDLLAWSQAIRAQKQLFLLDACQSGGALEGLAQRGAAEEKAIAQLARASGTHWLVASGAEQFAAEFKALGHGLFTYATLEALEGAAAGADRQLTVLELSSYLETRVPELALEHRGAQQYPASYGSGQDFPIALTRP